MQLRQFKKIISLSFMLILYGFCELVFANTLDTQLSSDHVAVGDSFYVTYTMENNNNINGSPDFSALQKDFRILNTYYSTAFKMINGVTSNQLSWRLQLEPLRSGQLTLPEISIGNDKSISRILMVSSAPVNQAPNSSAATNGRKGSPVFVRGEVSTSMPYVGSMVIYTFKLYFRDQLREPRLELPQTKNFTLFQLGEMQDYQTTISGETYNVAEKKFAIFPHKPGSLSIGPFLFHAFALDENSNLFFDPFNPVQPQPVTVSTKAFDLTVRDVPANYQEGTWLPAKDISLVDQWSDSSGHWEAGSPVTRSIRIEAQGLHSDQLPDLRFDKINGVNVYADKPKRSNIIRNDTLVGVYEQQITYIPDNVPSFTIPQLKLNWWNTQTNTNEILKTNAMAVQVKTLAKATNSPATPVIPAVTSSQTVAVKTVQPAAKPFYSSVWFWVACVLLAAWLLTLWFMLRKKPDKNVTLTASVSLASELNDKTFEQACHAGDAVHAQQFLLNWAKKKWPLATLNLATLKELVDDEFFSAALLDLERKLYARKAVAWKGEALLAAFQQVSKMKKYEGKVKSVREEVLPPLHPVE